MWWIVLKRINKLLNNQNSVLLWIGCKFTILIMLYLWVSAGRTKSQPPWRALNTNDATALLIRVALLWLVYTIQLRCVGIPSRLRFICVHIKLLCKWDSMEVPAIRFRIYAVPFQPYLIPLPPWTKRIIHWRTRTECMTFPHHSIHMASR